MAKIDSLFDKMLAMGASDLHLMEGQRPKIRQHGHLIAIQDEDILQRETMEAYLSEIAGPDRWSHFIKTHDLDFAYAKDETVRYRTNFYYHLYGLGAVFRTIPSNIASLKDLNLPPVLNTFSKLRSGLVLVTGPTGSGKSTTLAAIINEINLNLSRYILTIEEPIEFVHIPNQSVFCQREVGVDTHSFAEGLRTSVRQDVDVILVGEMRDYETISLALSAAAMGSLVFGTLHTNSAIKTVDRIIDVFPPEQQDKARTTLSDTLRGVCAQLLLKQADGKGRLAACEILLATQGLASSIREGNTSNIRNIMQGGKNNGMQLMDDVIESYLKKGLIHGEEAYYKAFDKGRFLAHMPK